MQCSFSVFRLAVCFVCVHVFFMKNLVIMSVDRVSTSTPTCFWDQSLSSKFGSLTLPRGRTSIVPRFSLSNISLCSFFMVAVKLLERPCCIWADADLAPETGFVYDFGDVRGLPGNRYVHWYQKDACAKPLMSPHAAIFDIALYCDLMLQLIQCACTVQRRFVIDAGRVWWFFEIMFRKMDMLSTWCLGLKLIDL